MANAMDVLRTMFGSFLVTVAALFPTVNRPEAAALFHVLTRNLSVIQQRAIARRVAPGGLDLLQESMLPGPWSSRPWGGNCSRRSAGPTTPSAGFPPTRWCARTPFSVGVLALADVALHGVGAIADRIAIGLSVAFAYRFARDPSRLLGASGVEVLGTTFRLPPDVHRPRVPAVRLSGTDRLVRKLIHRADSPCRCGQ